MASRSNSNEHASDKETFKLQFVLTRLWAFTLNVHNHTPASSYCESYRFASASLYFNMGHKSAVPAKAKEGDRSTMTPAQKKGAFCPRES